MKAIDRGGDRHYFDLLGKSIVEEGKDKCAAFEAYLIKNNQPEALYQFRIIEKYYGAVKEKNILAWDYARYIALCRWGYQAGYITEDEEWQKIMPVARLLQKTFDSWDDLGQDYLIGRKYMSYDGKFSDNYLFEAAYKHLCTDKSSLWHRYSWEMVLGDLGISGHNSELFIRLIKGFYDFLSLVQGAVKY